MPIRVSLPSYYDGVRPFSRPTCVASRALVVTNRHNHSFNAAEDDILVRSELEAIAKKYPDRFQLHYTLDNPPKSWAYSTGFISKDMISQYLYIPDASKKIQIFMCGPPPMIKFACYPNLEALGFTDDDWFTF